MRHLISSTCVLALLCGLLDDAQSDKGHGCALKVIDADSEKSVCVCNASYCDSLVVDWPTSSGEGLLVQSTRSGYRFNVDRLSAGRTDGDAIRFDVNMSDIREKILGFGGAFTDSAGLNIQSLPEEVRDRLMEDYYGQDGAQYTFGRVTISGSDFSTRNYTYDDMPDNQTDFELEHWSLQDEDYNYKIPLIKMAQRLTGERDSSLKLFASSWSPPTFMKTSGSLIQGHLIDTDQVYRSYAQYLVKFYEAYNEHGIEFWGGTVQNEPVTGSQPWYFFNSLEMSPDEAIKLVSKYLGPALAEYGYHKDNFKLMINDDALERFEHQVTDILDDEGAQKYIAGLAFHWYYSGSKVSYNRINETYNKVKPLVEFLLQTEACNSQVDLGNWEHGENYACDIIKDLERGAAGWIDWNLALDEQGGPNWVSNYVDSPVIVNKDKAEYYKQPMFYVLAHFSRFFTPESVKVGVSTSSDGDQLMASAVHKRDTDHVVVNILNKSEDEKLVELNVQSENGGKSWSGRVQGKSMNTAIIKM